jgi:hypothetical protein
MYYIILLMVFLFAILKKKRKKCVCDVGGGDDYVVAPQLLPHPTFMCFPWPVPSATKSGHALVCKYRIE